MAAKSKGRNLKIVNCFTFYVLPFLKRNLKVCTYFSRVLIHFRTYKSQSGISNNLLLYLSLISQIILVLLTCCCTADKISTPWVISSLYSCLICACFSWAFTRYALAWCIFSGFSHTLGISSSPDFNRHSSWNIFKWKPVHI